MKHKALLLSAILFLGTAVLVGYRVVVLHYPLFPSAKVKAWRVVADLRLDPAATGGKAAVRIALPQNLPEQSVIDERFISGEMEVQLLTTPEGRFSRWTGAIGKKEEYIGYEATVVIRQRPEEEEPPPRAVAPPASLTGEEKSLLSSLAAAFSALPADRRRAALTGAAAGQWHGKPPVAATLAAWERFRQTHGPVRSLVFLLQAAGLPAREMTGLVLAEGIFTTPGQWPEVWTGKNWEILNPETGNTHPGREKMLALTYGGQPAIDFKNVEIREARWTLSRQLVSPWRMHLEPALHANYFLNRWSLFSLPPEFQDTFRIILLVPIGALMICFLRNVIGFPTFGIFMPVLMALAFRNTGLFYGLAIFAGVVFIGFLARSRVNSLRLLLVPRLAAILTLVVVCFLILSLVGNKLGLRNMMAVGLLPFVILTMTIERFYILIEESGVKEALMTAAGSAAVAMLTYGVLQWERLQLLFFVYPEMLLSIAALQILLGRYTGYRLSEYIRFRAFKELS